MGPKNTGWGQVVILTIEKPGGARAIDGHHAAGDPPSRSEVRERDNGHRGW